MDDADSGLLILSRWRMRPKRPGYALEGRVEYRDNASPSPRGLSGLARTEYGGRLNLTASWTRVVLEHNASAWALYEYR